MRVFPFFIITCFLALSCDKKTPYGDDAISGSPCTAVIISNEVYQDLDPNQASVSELSIEGDCLKVKLGVSGCDSDHMINMISNGGIAESNPPQITFDFQDENPQVCLAFFMIEREFDLVPIRDLIEDDIIIRFRNSEHSILYIE
ncbi:MAG: hypothetical protein ACJA1A_002889 [Saprospiraceae bacterium]|jgi:hypothetical protein